MFWNLRGDMYYTFKKLSCLAQLASFSSKLNADMYQVGSIRIVHNNKLASFIVPFSMAYRGALIHSVLLPGSLLCSPIARLRKHSSASLVLIAIRRPLSYDVALNNFLIFKCNKSALLFYVEFSTTTISWYTWRQFFSCHLFFDRGPCDCCCPQCHDGI